MTAPHWQVDLYRCVAHVWIPFESVPLLVRSLCGMASANSTLLRAPDDEDCFCPECELAITFTPPASTALDALAVASAERDGGDSGEGGTA